MKLDIFSLSITIINYFTLSSSRSFDETLTRKAKIVTLVPDLPYRNDKVVTMLFYNLVTTTLGTTLYFETVARLLQGGGKATTKALSQPCIKQDCQTHHKVPFLVCFLANQACTSFLQYKLSF